MTEPRHTVTWRTPAWRYDQVAQYALSTGLSLNDAVSVMVDDFLSRQRLLADEACVPLPRSQDST
jgi:hypothetical protein